MNLPADLMTARDLSARLGVSLKSVYASIEAGEIPGVKRIGRLIRIHKPTIEAWLAKDHRKSA